MADDLVTVAVRGFGYGSIHAAQIPPSLLEVAYWPSRAYPFTAIRTPVAAVCGVRVRSIQPCVAVMELGTELTCPACRVLVRRRGLEITYPQVHEARSEEGQRDG